jgi:Glycosyl hydrolases family 43
MVASSVRATGIAGVLAFAAALVGGCGSAGSDAKTMEGVGSGGGVSTPVPAADRPAEPQQPGEVDRSTAASGPGGVAESEQAPSNIPLAGEPNPPGAAGGAGGSEAVADEPQPILVPGAWGDQGDGTFQNPVLWADYDNLDVISAGGEFFMVAASHHVMGMPSLRSKDMVNWRLISRIYGRLDLATRYDEPGQAYQHGSWAPAIRYHDDRFWVYVTTPWRGC